MNASTRCLAARSRRTCWSSRDTKTGRRSARPPSTWSRTGWPITITPFTILNYYSRNLGMFMMTSAVEFFAGRGFESSIWVVLHPNALYKTQFAGAEFFNGVRWSDDLDRTEVSDSAEATGTSTCSKTRNTGRPFMAGTSGRVA